ncbi:MAG: pyridoxamine 5'-phosphate oxidase family protein [Microgenomates group bacterium]
MSWQQTVEERQEVTIVTSSPVGVPHAIIAVSLGLIDGKLLLGAALMKTTLENLKNNNKIVLITKANGEYYRLVGSVEISTSGKYLDTALSKSNPPMPTAAILVEITEIFDLDKQQTISL